MFKKYSQIEQGHPGSVLSIFDIINYLYLSKSIDLSKKKTDRNRLIISKGHAASVQYPYLVKSKLASNADS